MSTTTQRPRVIIIGAGFGGLYAARRLAKEDVDVLLVDRQNFHLFSPLLYQVATSGLDPSEIAYPVRGIFRGKDNVRFLMGEVERINPDRKTIDVRTNGETHPEAYDYLIVAAGSQTHYFGMDQVQQHAFGLKTLAEAVSLRNHLLTSFEKAAWSKDDDYRQALTTMVVVGGGPTGLETAGALYELYEHVLRQEYEQQLGDITGRVIMVELQDHLLDPYPAKLQEAARRQLEGLGVEVILGNGVKEAADDHIVLSDGTVIRTHTLVWAAGVKASPLAEMLDVELQRGGRVPVEPTMEVIGRPDIYVVGDMSYLEDKNGSPYPMLIPVAKQQGITAARNIFNRIEDQPEKAFRYRDRGIMATIGRRRAVAWIYYRIQLTGYLAWLAWLFLHLVTLMGFRNRLNVFVNWVWNYFTYDRSVRIILKPGGVTDSEAQPGSIAMKNGHRSEGVEETLQETVPISEQ
ncbi:MAG: NAD(P)/FAD-dependent oxidoreductase [Chloroflexi bacterium]|nr:NAD(P)/FAD-dependent oxidoreductase [Chloroflexota bacterium]